MDQAITPVEVTSAVPASRSGKYLCCDDSRHHGSVEIHPAICVRLYFLEIVNPSQTNKTRFSLPPKGKEKYFYLNTS